MGVRSFNTLLQFFSRSLDPFDRSVRPELVEGVSEYPFALGSSKGFPNIRSH
jgi:hypothetical protein